MSALPGTRYIERSELVRIVDEASKPITSSTRDKLLHVAQTTGAVAVNWFHCDGVNCPTRQAGRSHMAFQRDYDVMMSARFHVASNEAFVVTVKEASADASH